MHHVKVTMIKLMMIKLTMWGAWLEPPQVLPKLIKLMMLKLTMHCVKVTMIKLTMQKIYDGGGLKKIGLAPLQGAPHIVSSTL